MPYKPKRTLIERAAVMLGLIPDTDAGATRELPPHKPLQRYPAPEQWADFVEHDPRHYPRRAEGRRYRLVPTVCFNCESACGLLAYVDKDTNTIRKFEGNPVHPGSRGKNCAKGPATINQVNDPDRILTPLKRAGKRGEGKWQPLSWAEALEDIGGRIRTALQENRRDEIVYHVGRPGSEGFVDRVLRAWGVDGQNTHTNICSAGARFGYAIWSGFDRPSPDYANARFILALNAKFESGHYFNPHAQRLREGMARGAKLAVVDPRLSNTASLADYWLPTKPGTEAALLLALAHVILAEDLFDRAFIERWVNWREYLEAREEEGSGFGVRGSEGKSDASSDSPEDAPASSHSHVPTFPRSHAAATVDEFIATLKHEYARFTPDFAAAECGIPAAQIREIARLIGDAGSRFCSHTWRGAASGHLGGWQVARCLFFLNVLTGSVGTVGGCSPSGWHKYKAKLIDPPPPNNEWNELSWPREYPLTHYELSFLLPHLLKDGRGKIDVYFTRVFNPVWTYPDGFTWIEALSDESKIGLHVALTPTWNETALFADYVLPMGHGPERHDLTTYETHNAAWIAFRQPVLRAHLEAEGAEVPDTRAANPGQVWEEDEFWIALCWAIDPDGALGIRKYFESKQHAGEKLTVDEYYTHIFDRVPGLPEAAREEDLAPLEYIRRYGAFCIQDKVYNRHERRLSVVELDGAQIDPETGVVTKNGAAIGVCPDIARSGIAPGGTAVSAVLDEAVLDEAVLNETEEEHGRHGRATRAAQRSEHAHGASPLVVEGFHTPSRLLEFYSPTMAEWGWPESAIPGYIGSHIWEEKGLREEKGPREGTGNADRGSEEQSKIENRKSKITNPQSQIHNPKLEACLLPTFRLPTLIHTRSGSAKWLNEISQRNPVWIHTADAQRLGGLRTDDLVRVTTEIGFFVDKVWVTEGIRPGVVAVSHHLGRWRRSQDPPSSRWSGSVVSVEQLGGGKWRMRRESGPQPFDSDDADSRRIWWREGGVPQNLTHAVHPDPISGMHCWHQRVTVEPARDDDRTGDVFVDTSKSMQVYRDWLAKTRVEPLEQHKLRRPLWLNRPLRPTDAAYRL